MYNLYKYQEDVKIQENMRKQDQNYTKWLVRHEQMKANATQKIKQRTKQFISEQLVNPASVEDDHYQTWRYNKQFRDIQDSNKFIGFKTFRHRPNYDVGKYFTERQRKYITYIAQKSQELLVKSQRIPNELRSRSLRSQGPLNPKHTFRDRKSDNQYIQPRMRYTNITDKQRQLQNSISYDDKFSKVFENFSMTKSKIGKISKSQGKDINSGFFDRQQSTYSEAGKNQQYHFDANLENNYEEKSAEKKNISKLGQSSILFRESPRKSYFKNAKTMALNGDPLASSVMIQTQYDRQKDLSNIKKNWDNQNFQKIPIL